MNIKTIFVGSSSACFELENQNPYYAPEPYQIFLNGEEAFVCDSNVFSLFSLEADRDYQVELKAESFETTFGFHTVSETCAISVKDFGAVGDGATDDTEAIRMAIGYLPAGGRLVFPEGVYRTRPLLLKSHMTLELMANARILGTPHREEWPIAPGAVQSLSGKEVYFGGFEGDSCPMYQSLITAQYAEDIRIVGQGFIDGNAEEAGWWVDFKSFPAARPRLMFFNRCKDIVIHGIHACQSPSWQLHPYYSENIGIYQVHISAPKISPNTDAIDPESCDHVEIIGCTFAVGDDCIAIKSSKIELGTKLNVPADHHTIRNCLMEHGHGGVVLGSEIGAGVRNLTVSHCYFRQTDRGVRIKSRRGRGKNCRLDGLLFENIRMEDVLTPIAINMWYNCCDPDRESEYVWSREKLPVDERTPYMGRFHFKDIDCTGAEVAACYIDGLPEAPIEEVTFENYRVSFADNAKPGIPIMENFARERCRLGLYLDNVRHILLNSVQVDGFEGEEIIANHYEKLEKTNIRKG